MKVTLVDFLPALVVFHMVEEIFIKIKTEFLTNF